jgi:hypothetical protein
LLSQYKISFILKNFDAIHGNLDTISSWKENIVDLPRISTLILYVGLRLSDWNLYTPRSLWKGSGTFVWCVEHFSEVVNFEEKLNRLFVMFD